MSDGDKFWSSAQPGDDIHLICHPDDEQKISEIMKPLEIAVKLFGPFPITVSHYVKQGGIIFINKTKHKTEIQKWSDYLSILYVPLMKTNGIVITGCF